MNDILDINLSAYTKFVSFDVVFLPKRHTQYCWNYMLDKNGIISTIKAKTLNLFNMSLKQNYF